jgi:alanine dehydrogenase
MMKKTKKISIIKETRQGEGRVILMPIDARLFVEQGYEVLVEEGAGELAGAPDTT